MKSKLSPEQSHRLIELGVDPSRASGSAKVYEPIDDNHRWESETPIFTLTDILSILPKTFLLHGDICQLEIKWHGDEWVAKYDDSESDYFYTEHSPELSDALYELLVWTIEHRYIKL